MPSLAVQSTYANISIYINEQRIYIDARAEIVTGWMHFKSAFISPRVLQLSVLLVGCQVIGEFKS